MSGDNVTSVDVAPETAAVAGMVQLLRDLRWTIEMHDAAMNNQSLSRADKNRALRDLSSVMKGNFIHRIRARLAAYQKAIEVGE